MRNVIFGVWMGLLAATTTTMAQEAVFTDSASNTRYIVEEYLPANFPVGMVFTPDGRLLYNEKTTGSVRLVAADGTRQIEPVINLNTSALQERGMLGITLDPNFETNNRVYLMHTLEGTAQNYAANRLVRFRLEDGFGVDLEELFIEPITNGQLLHNGGNVHFDDEGYLFLSLGDYGEPAHGQDLNTPQAAIHRFVLTDTGLRPAPGNPFGDDNSIYAYGLRNPFDFAFDPLTGNLFATENGPSCDDEVNLILAGFNYGWSENYECVGRDVIPGLTLYSPPLLTYTPTISPAGITFYDGEAFPAWQGNLFFCAWNTATLYRVVLDEARTAVASIHEMPLGDIGCRIDLEVGPEGGLYFGTVGEFGGAIMRILPA